MASHQLPPEELDRYLQPVWDATQPLTPLRAAEEAGGDLLAEGYETAVTVTAPVAGESVTWTERRLRRRSPTQAESEEAALRDRVGKTVTRLEALNERL